jgi:hypothetical protein
MTRMATDSCWLQLNGCFSEGCGLSLRASRCREFARAFDSFGTRAVGRRSTPTFDPVAEQVWNVADPVDHREDVYSPSDTIENEKALEPGHRPLSQTRKPRIFERLHGPYARHVSQSPKCPLDGRDELHRDGWSLLGQVINVLRQVLLHEPVLRQTELLHPALRLRFNPFLTRARSRSNISGVAAANSPSARRLRRSASRRRSASLFWSSRMSCRTYSLGVRKLPSRVRRSTNFRRSSGMERFNEAIDPSWRILMIYVKQPLPFFQIATSSPAPTAFSPGPKGPRHNRAPARKDACP